MSDIWLYENKLQQAVDVEVMQATWSLASKGHGANDA
jgi:hypothetical protein